MRIDASTLLLAAQAQAMRPSTGKTAALPNRSELLEVTRPSGGDNPKPTPLPGAISRPGAQLDIKV
jgi:hypothetical protein